MQPPSPTFSHKRPSELNIKRNRTHNRADEILFSLHNIIEIWMLHSKRRLVDSPVPTTTLVLLKRATLTFISPFQKGESIGFGVTCARVLLCKYLFRKI